MSLWKIGNRMTLRGLKLSLGKDQCSEWMGRERQWNHGWVWVVLVIGLPSVILTTWGSVGEDIETKHSCPISLILSEGLSRGGQEGSSHVSVLRKLPVCTLYKIYSPRPQTNFLSFIPHLYFLSFIPHLFILHLIFLPPPTPSKIASSALLLLNLRCHHNARQVKG